MIRMGLGVDIEDIDRFRKLDLYEDKGFFSKIYTGDEISYCFSKDSPAQHLAVRFAGKEAVVKNTKFSRCLLDSLTILSFFGLLIISLCWINMTCLLNLLTICS